MTRPTSGSAKIWVLPNAESASLKTAELFAEAAAEAITNRRVFRVALAGGSTPKQTYELLASDDRFTNIDWPHVRVFFTDERCVTPDDEQSNYRMIKESLLDHVKVCDNCVHRMQGELTAVPAANLYEQVILDEFPADDDRLDFVLLGLAADGHTASLFPGTEALTITDASCFGNEVPRLDDERVTLTFPFLNNARQIVFLVTGPSKTETLAKVLTADRDLNHLPAQGIQPNDGELHWITDEPAAANLPRDLLTRAGH